MIDRDSPVSLHAQVRQLIQDEILSGKLSPGDPLPPDRAICARYDVSRITVTRALGDLVAAGLVRRVQGKGTFVAQTRIRRAVGELSGLTESLRLQGLRTRARVLALGPAAPEDLPQELAGLPGSFVRLVRLRFVDETPAVHSISFLDAGIVAGLVPRALETQSLYDLIERRTGRPIVRNEQVMTPVVADDALAALLGVAVGSPHMAFQGTTVVAGERVAELTRSVFRGDMFEFKASIRRAGDTLE
jgi:GntR family transcriptional regulator